MRTATWFALASALALAGCVQPDENPRWNPRADYPAWTYDSPFYYRPSEDLKVVEFAGGDIPVYYSRSEYFFIAHPAGTQVGGEPRIAVWQSADKGRNWQRAGFYGVEQTHFLFKADGEGPQWIRFVGPGQDSSAAPPARPQRIYVVDQTPPQVQVMVKPPCWEDQEQEEQEEPLYRVGDSVTVCWKAHDLHLQGDGVKLQICFPRSPGNVIWREYPKGLSSRGSMNVVIPAEAREERGLLFRVQATDKAGNVGAAMSSILHVEGRRQKARASDGCQAQAIPAPDETPPASPRRAPQEAQPARPRHAPAEARPDRANPARVEALPARGRPAEETELAEPQAEEIELAEPQNEETESPDQAVQTTVMTWSPTTRPAAVVAAMHTSHEPAPADADPDDGAQRHHPKALPEAADPTARRHEAVAGRGPTTWVPGRGPGAPARPARSPEELALMAQEGGTMGEKPGLPEPSSLLRGRQERYLKWLPEIASQYVSLELQFSHNDGQTWRTVATDLQAGKIAKWRVPSATSKACRLRIVGETKSGGLMVLAESRDFTVETVAPDTIMGPTPLMAEH